VFSSVLRHRWLGDRNGIRHIKPVPLFLTGSFLVSRTHGGAVETEEDSDAAGSHLEGQHFYPSIFKPHRSTTWSSVVCPSVTIVSGAKTAKPIEMAFGLWIRLVLEPRNHVLDGGPEPPCDGAILRGKGRPIVKYLCRELCKRG